MCIYEMGCVYIGRKRERAVESRKINAECAVCVYIRRGESPVGVMSARVNTVQPRRSGVLFIYASSSLSMGGCVSSYMYTLYLYPGLLSFYFVIGYGSPWIIGARCASIHGL